MNCLYFLYSFGVIFDSFFLKSLGLFHQGCCYRGKFCLGLFFDSFVFLWASLVYASVSLFGHSELSFNRQGYLLVLLFQLSFLDYLCVIFHINQCCSCFILILILFIMKAIIHQRALPLYLMFHFISNPEF